MIYTSVRDSPVGKFWFYVGDAQGWNKIGMAKTYFTLQCHILLCFIEQYQFISSTAGILCY